MQRLLFAWDDLKWSPLAYGLRIIIGKIILYFGTPERLQTLRCSIFTGGVVTENGSCSAAFCESAALRKGFLLTFSGLNPLRRSRASSPEGGAKPLSLLLKCYEQ